MKKIKLSSLLVIALSIHAGCKFLKYKPKDAHIHYRFTPTQDSTFIGAWGKEMPDAWESNYLPIRGKSFHIVIAYSKNNKIYIPTILDASYDTSGIERHMHAGLNNYLNYMPFHSTPEWRIINDTTIYDYPSKIKLTINEDNNLVYYIYDSTEKIGDKPYQSSIIYKWPPYYLIDDTIHNPKKVK
jgi:hypothetical protein